jgi:hypothetical protein
VLRPPEHRESPDFSHGEEVKEKRANGVPKAYPRRRQRCYLSVTGVRRKSRLELVKKWGNIALHSVFKPAWSRNATRAAACVTVVLQLKYSSSASAS